jgi:DNA-binding NtrC family response regulator
MEIENQECHVLFVDDEVNFLHAIRRALREEAYKKYFAGSALEALKILKTENFSVVVTDLKMPGVDGIDFLKVVKKKYPDIIRVIVTGISDIPSILSAIHNGETHRYLTKPLNIESDLIPTLRQSLEWFHIKREKKKMLEEMVRLNKELTAKNEEIEFFKKLAENADDKKTRLLDKIRKALSPLMAEIDSLHEQCTGRDIGKELTVTLDGLNRESRRLEELLKEIEYYFVKIDFSACETQGGL